MKKCEIYFIRHGESTANLQKLVTGEDHVPLTEKGREQAVALKKYSDDFARIGIQEVWVSPMQRALETAKLAFPNMPYQIEPLLAETNAGECKNWTQEKFNESFPDFWKTFLSAKNYPGGESHDDLANRVTKWIKNLLKEDFISKKILVVAHNGSLAALLHWALKVPMDLFPAFQVPNASISRLDIAFNNDKFTAQLRLLGILPSLESIIN